MHDNQYDTVIDALTDLRDQGYTYTFDIEQDGARCLETGKLISPDQITIEQYHRFEGDTDVDDMAVIYVVSSSAGLKGTIVDAYGAYANTHMPNFLDKVNFEADK